MSDLKVLGLALLALLAAMAGAWAVQRATRNCGWVDGIWSAATALVAAGLAVAGPGDPARRGAMAVMLLIWGGRLALHILARTPGAPEDARYAAFRRDWGAAFERRLFSFLMIQGVCAWVLALAVWAAARNPAAMGWLDYAAIALLAAAVAGEGVADRQMEAFRARARADGAAGRGRVCDAGLWAYSRHPNYFFEFLGWCAYPLMALSGGMSDWVVLLAWLAPLQMYWLLRHVSGVPPLETAMLASRGAAYAAYQARVSVFFPWPPRRAATGTGDAP